jgi:hypothetical protein
LFNAHVSATFLGRISLQTIHHSGKKKGGTMDLQSYIYLDKAIHSKFQVFLKKFSVKPPFCINSWCFLIRGEENEIFGCLFCGVVYGCYHFYILGYSHWFFLITNVMIFKKQCHDYLQQSLMWEKKERQWLI